MSAVVLLVEHASGDTVGIRFPDADTARAWEDDHITELTVRGCVRIVSKREALSDD